ncbi:hypothetical protein [Lentibacillus kimchii]|uniref:hypothetical protein n=1 Tax=Lentibacillus kimchii TaxID=1542911 RepID=UPI0036D23F2F
MYSIKRSRAEQQLPVAAPVPDTSRHRKFFSFVYQMLVPAYTTLDWYMWHMNDK